MLHIVMLSLIGSFASAETPKMDLGRTTAKHVMAKADLKKEKFGKEELKKWPHTIQVAAYLSEDDALEHVKELKKSEKNTFYYSTFVRGQVWYKVCVGRYETAKQAAKYQRRFIKKHDEPFSVVISLNKGIQPMGKVAKVGELKRKIASTATKPVIVKTEEKKPIKIMHKATPKAKATSGMKPVAATATSFKKYYSVQVAAFSSKSEAQKQLDSYVTKGMTGQIEQAEVKGSTWYRVVLGHFADYKAATEYKDQFKTQYKIDGLVRKFKINAELFLKN